MGFYCTVRCICGFAVGFRITVDSFRITVDSYHLDIFSTVFDKIEEKDCIFYTAVKLDELCPCKFELST